MQATVLGISPGTRLMGIAVMRGHSLIDWRVKFFMEKWTARKIDRVISAVERSIAQYQITHIVMKEIHPRNSSASLRQVGNAMLRLAKEKNIPISTTSLKILKTDCLSFGSGKFSIEGLYRYVSIHFPEAGIKTSNAPDIQTTQKVLAIALVKHWDVYKHIQDTKNL